MNGTYLLQLIVAAFLVAQSKTQGSLEGPILWTKRETKETEAIENRNTIFSDASKRVDASSIDLLESLKTDSAKIQKVIFRDYGFSEFLPNTNSLVLSNATVNKLSKLSKQNSDVTYNAILQIHQFDLSSRWFKESYAHYLPQTSTLVTVKAKGTTTFKVEIILMPNYRSMEGKFLKIGPEYYLIHITITAPYSIGGKIKYASQDILKAEIPKGRFKLHKWFKLMIRMVNAKDIYLYYNCRLLKKWTLQRKSFPHTFSSVFLHTTQIRIAQTFTKASSDVLEGLSGEPFINHRFIGFFMNSKFLFGKKGFEKLSSCPVIHGREL